MDTKLKGSKNKYIISGIILLILIISSIGMYSTYPKIKEQAKKHERSVFENWEVANVIRNFNHSIYFDILSKVENKKLKPADILLDKNKKYDNEQKQDIKDAKNSFNQEIYANKKILEEDFKNLEYYAIEQDSKLSKNRSLGKINVLLNDNIDSKNVEMLKKQYSSYIIIDYNHNGDITIKNIYGADKHFMIGLFGNGTLQGQYTLKLKPIKNMTYIYAIPKELKYDDSIVYYKNNNERNSYREVTCYFIIIVAIFAMLGSIIIPYKISKELIGFKKITRIPIEISSTIIVTGIMIYIEESYKLIISTMNGNLFSLLEIDLSKTITDLTNIISISCWVINVCCWVIYFGLIFVGVVIIKHIFKTGMKEYIKTNSLLYKILKRIWTLLKSVWGRCVKTYRDFKTIDLKEKSTKKLVILLGIVLIILAIMSFIVLITIMSGWLFNGIVVTAIYITIIFIVIIRIYKDISNKYNKLLEATSKIAQGNLEVNIEENLGMFNAFKVELKNIHQGFKKAVNEEVKSQRMKTELISNVSHDLKTPLTSIITYVDLLKDENLSKEKRKEYLDTLDRKSQRLQELIEDLFEVSKATSGNINLNLVDVDVVALMKQTLLELDDKILKSALVVKTNYPEDKVILHLDSQRMFRVFENLIINITKYAMVGSRVYIDIIHTENKVKIILKNMAASEIDFNVNEIMERFVRGDKARNTEGSGLGLAIAKSFVELQGGDLNIIVDGDLFKVAIELNQ